MFGAYTPLNYFFLALGAVAFIVEAWALIDAITRPGPAFVATGKQTKPLWLIILGVAMVVGLYTITYGGGPSAIGILSIAAFVAAAIYLTDVRPKVRGINGGGGGTSSGPYGPW